MPWQCPVRLRHINQVGVLAHQLQLTRPLVNSRVTYVDHEQENSPTPPQPPVTLPFPSLQPTSHHLQASLTFLTPPCSSSPTHTQCGHHTPTKSCPQHHTPQHSRTTPAHAPGQARTVLARQSQPPPPAPPHTSAPPFPPRIMPPHTTPLPTLTLPHTRTWSSAVCVAPAIAVSAACAPSHIAAPSQSQTTPPHKWHLSHYPHTWSSADCVASAVAVAAACAPSAALVHASATTSLTGASCCT